jgi:hypothetical protein
VLTLPYVSQVFAIQNVPLQQKQQRMEAQAFRLRMAAIPIPADGDGMLYALYGDPDNLEKGGHRYWLIMVQKNPYAAPKGLKCAQGKTINAGNWIVNARWLLCVSDDPNHKAYELMPVADPDPRCPCKQITPHVHVRMSSFITELGLKWAHYARARGGPDGAQARRSTGIFANESHLAIMRYNFSNVA